MTAAGTLELEETIEHLDFEVPCDVSDCDRGAAFVAVRLCCGGHFLLCAEHVVERITKWETQTFLTVLWCEECFAVVPVRMWRALIRFEPIGGGS